MKALFSLKDWKVSTKVLVFSLASTVAVAATIGVLAVSRSSEALVSGRAEALYGVVEARRHEVVSYFDQLRDQIAVDAQDPGVVEALKAFSAGFAGADAELAALQAGGDPVASLRSYFEQQFRPRLEKNGRPFRGAETYTPRDRSAQWLQAMYIANNANAVGEKLKLERAPEAIGYNQAHERFHAGFRRRVEMLGYYDVFLIDLSGNIVYTVFKETDFATNLTSGPYAGSNLARAFREALMVGTPGESVVVDYEPYEPSYGGPASFIAAPVFEDGKRVGVLAFQMPVDRINAIVSVEKGLGESGLTYLMASDGRMRSNSRLEESATIFVREVETEVGASAVEAVRTGTAPSALMGVEGLYGKRVVAAVEPLGVEGLEWAIVGEVDESEVLASARSTATGITVATVLGACLAAVPAVLLAGSIVRPIRSVVRAADELSSGEFSGRLPEDRGDELGDLARSVNKMINMIAGVAGDMRESAEQLSAAAMELSASTQESAGAMQNQERETSSIASAIEEMAASVKQVAEQCADASMAAERAGQDAASGGSVVQGTVAEIRSLAERVRQSSEQVMKLGERSQQISDIIATINEIADQTNLLALNAAIEAARAGEHGRGFAVVADEVRKLAERTTKATEEVASSIRQIQDESAAAVRDIEASAGLVDRGVRMAGEAGQALERIVSGSEGLLGTIRTIAAATKEQEPVATEIARSIQSVNQLAGESSARSGEVLRVTEDLALKAGGMAKTAERFRINRREANRGAPETVGERRRRTGG